MTVAWLDRHTHLSNEHNWLTPTAPAREYSRDAKDVTYGTGCKAKYWGNKGLLELSRCSMSCITKLIAHRNHWNISIFLTMVTVVTFVPPITFLGRNVHIMDLSWNSLISYLGGVLSPINHLFTLLVQQYVCVGYVLNYNQTACIFWS